MLQQTVLQRYAPDAVRQRRWPQVGSARCRRRAAANSAAIGSPLKRGRLNADINVSNLGQLSKALERAAVTTAIAIVTAAFATGLAPYLMHSSLRLWGIPLFPLLGAQPAAGVVLLALRLRR